MSQQIVEIGGLKHYLFVIEFTVSVKLGDRILTPLDELDSITKEDLLKAPMLYRVLIPYIPPIKT